ncbi:hypothetical protein AAG906_037293 [Vitis piasezkii]
MKVDERRAALINGLHTAKPEFSSCRRGCVDGNVRIWKDSTLKDQQKLVTAFSSIQGHRPGVRKCECCCGLATTIRISGKGSLTVYYAAGKISSIMAWDLDKEQLVYSIPSLSDSSMGFASSLYWFLTFLLA